MTRTETSFENISTWNVTGAHISGNGPKQAFRLLQNTKTGDEAHDHWLTVVQAYSNSRLTYEKDKLIALAGLVEHFQRTTNDKYCAGLWRNNLPLQLAWHSQSSTEVSSVSRSNRAPSWSWLANNEPVTFPSRAELQGYDVQDLIQEVECDVKQIDSRDGDILEGYLQMKAALTHLSSGGADADLQLTTPLTTPFMPSGSLTCNFDCNLGATNDSEFFFLPLFSVLFKMTVKDEFDNTGIIQGLILRPSASDKTGFIRCGQAVLSVQVTELFAGIDSYMRGTRSVEQAIKLW